MFPYKLCVTEKKTYLNSLSSNGFCCYYPLINYLDADHAGHTGHVCHSHAGRTGQVGHDGLTGFHEAVVDQPLPQEEQLLMASEEIVSAPTLHITEAFQPGKLF